MRPVLVVLAFVGALVAGSLSHESVCACGDKALTVGRGIKYGRAYAAIHPAVVALYSRPGGAPLAPQLDKHLKRAGHRVVTAGDPPGLRELLTSTPIDIVVASRSDAQIVESHVAAAASHPSFVCVNVDGGGSHAGADPQHECRLRSSDQPTRFLTEIDQVMKARLDASRQSARRRTN